MDEAMDIQDINCAWNVITKILRPCPKEGDASAPSREQFNCAVATLHHNGMSHIIRDWFMASFQDDLCNVIIPEFWHRFQNCQRGTFWKFPEAVNLLYDRLRSYELAIHELQSLQDKLLAQIHTLPPEGQTTLYNNKTHLMTEVFSVARCLLFAKWPVDFRAVLVDFFAQTFKCYQSKNKEVKEEEPALLCYSCDNKIDQCCCDQYLDAFNTTMKKLYELQLFQTIVGDVPINVAQDVLEKHIQEKCKGNYEAPLLNSLQLWLENTVTAWLASFYCQSSTNIISSDKLLSEYKDRLLNILYDAFTAIRMDQLFDIIIDFPDSQDALEDLKQCLEMTNARSKLISSLRSSLEKRLLHPGVNTADILTAYISAIKALRVLDRSGVVLQVVSEPFEEEILELRAEELHTGIFIYPAAVTAGDLFYAVHESREDTVRCIISSLREDSCGELACELMKGVPLKLEDTYPSDEEVDDWEKWCPDPVDVDPAKASEGQRSSDIIGILVNIYGSKELFVNEYRSLLADRILTTFSYNTEREIRYLELLKVRFGESQLHLCEVMLKDIADSKRLNTHLSSGEFKSYEQGDFPVNTMILSAQFWPSFKEEKLRLPEYIWNHLKKYTTAFEALKGNRTLVWKPHLGNVDLEIELKGRTLNLSVSPVHATILWHFQEKPRWTVSDLSNEMQLQASVLRRKITFWQNQGVLHEEENDVFVLMEEQKSTTRDSVVMIEEERESVTASSQDMKEEELQTFWSFIVGMLTNMESLPLERIHSMLRMFAVQGTSTNECSIQDMKQFLEKKVRDRQLVYTAGMFKLPKFDS